MTILLILLMSAMIIMFIAKARNPSVYWMSIILLGWFLSMSGLVLFIAKYGGFYYRVNIVLFFNDAIRDMLLHSPISIDGVSRMITIGRSLFIFGFIGLSLSLFYNNQMKHRVLALALHAILPLLNIIFYDPVIYKPMLSLLSPRSTYIISYITRGWLVISALYATSLIVYYYSHVTIPWLKKQIKHILYGVFALVLFYFYLGFMGPMQVTDVRTYYVLYSDFSNFNPPLTLFEWYLGIGITGILSGISLFSIWRYTDIEKKMGEETLLLERKLKTADMGIKVFTHGIKNQLLIIQVLLNQARQNPSSDDHGVSQEPLVKANVVVHETLERLDQLYRSIKTTHLQLRSVSICELMDGVLSRFNTGSRALEVHTRFEEAESITVLADQAHLSEAIYNILTNAAEAIPEEQRGTIQITSYPEGNFNIISITDNGCGMEKEQLRAIFDPFVTSKNTTRNWGVGLSYAKQIVHGHDGRIHVESKPGFGSTFQIVLPIYRKHTA
ncbi:ATP-binding protein [Paenibacillus sp. KQZ6P-2]|uniref:histidine kinase n=1 Tax=Paenibacillus mangrovi TaxID=2931978 RepID=A0A9X1WPR8_9BACL|nr:ATP-binding protein [Paenibacillus mangrovi]MCJ8013107.1 ATP-binding protein [Paenibacillus mangrovi]